MPYNYDAQSNSYNSFFDNSSKPQQLLPSLHPTSLANPISDGNSPTHWPSSSSNASSNTSIYNRRSGNLHHSQEGYHYMSTKFLKMSDNRLSTVVWNDCNVTCYSLRVSDKVTIFRRIDNDMVNGTKLLNSLGDKCTRGRRDGILKNTPNKVVVRRGASRFKGVWIPLCEARQLANQFRMNSLLFPLLEDKPDKYLKGFCDPIEKNIIADNLKNEDVHLQRKRSAQMFPSAIDPPISSFLPKQAQSEIGSLDWDGIPNLSSCNAVDLAGYRHSVDKLRNHQSSYDVKKNMLFNGFKEQKQSLISEESKKCMSLNRLLCNEKDEV